MLPSLGWTEMVLLAVLALVVVGPKDLPLLFRKLGRWTAKLRGMAQEFRTGFDELARQAELDELKREVESLRRATSLQDINRELTKPLPTLEDYAGVKSPAAPKPAPPAPALEAPAELEADETAAQGEAEQKAQAPETADAAPRARSAP